MLDFYRIKYKGVPSFNSVFKVLSSTSKKVELNLSVAYSVQCITFLVFVFHLTFFPASTIQSHPSSLHSLRNFSPYPFSPRHLIPPSTCPPRPTLDSDVKSMQREKCHSEELRAVSDKGLLMIPEKRETIYFFEEKLDGKEIKVIVLSFVTIFSSTFSNFILF